VRTSAGARFGLLFYAAALSPAFVSPVDRVDIVHAVALPVPAALLAAAAFAGLRRRWSVAPRARAAAAAAVTVAIAAGGTALFDVVNPRILPASAMGIVFRSLAPADASRVVVLDYPPAHAIDVRWLFTGVMTAYGGPVPLGYLPYAGQALPAQDLAAEARDLLFWSPGLDADLGVTAAVCRQWPAASLYEVGDAAGLGRVFAARVGERSWAPALPSGRWRRRACPASVAAPDSPVAVTPTRPAGSRATA
jgi:hypothetical protein